VGQNQLIAHIDRAGSSDRTRIQQALRQTDLKPSQLVIRYNGVRFDETGQNILSATYRIELQGATYKSVWPCQRATSTSTFPMTGRNR
jgi:branched-chain amino acid transport system substrate-binding protein